MYIIACLKTRMNENFNYIKAILDLVRIKQLKFNYWSAEFLKINI